MALKHIGQMTVAAGTSKNNLTTAIPFAIPVGTDSLLVLASGSDCYAEVYLGTSSAATTAALGTSIGTSQYQLPCTPTGGTSIGAYANILSVFNNNVASRTVDVWWIDA